MKIRLMKDMGIDGKHTLAGTVIEADAGFARYQASLSRAEIVPDDTPLGLPKKDKPAADPAPASDDKKPSDKKPADK